ncbi:MAG: metallophosphoesterase family protein [Isosphaeraceae bacterium]
MRLGLVTDMHNHVAELAAALEAFRSGGVDRVISIGDACDAFGRGAGIDEVARLLDQCGASGVWGNHDFTLCRDVSEANRRRFSAGVLEFMARMQPRLVVGGCHFSHKDASIDPFDIDQLWEIDGDDRPLDLMARARRGFLATDAALQFVGHYHRWWAATPSGPLAWAGEGPLHFPPGVRYFVGVAPVCDGWCGILDTDRRILEPYRCGARP